MLRSFALNLAALSYVALLVGMYLIYNTVAISVVQRRPEIGTLRALGATRRQIFATFLAEGMLFGVAGALLGLLLGALLAQFSVGAVAQTVDTLYVGTHADRVDYAPLVLAKAFFLGIALATLSALAPAVEAAATLPAITMRAAGYESRNKRPGLGLALAGLVAFAFAAFAARLPAVDSLPLFGYAAGLLIVAGASLCMPLAVICVAALGRRFATHLSPPARLAAANLGAAPRRAAVAVAALMVAIGMMVSVAILIGSFRTTVVAWADETLKADLFVRPLGLQDASTDSRFSPRVASRVAALPGVAAVDTFRAITIPFRGSLTTLAATDLASVAARRKLRFLGNVDTATLARTLPNSNRVLVSEPFATRFNVRPGDTLHLDTPSGRVALGCRRRLQRLLERRRHRHPRRSDLRKTLPRRLARTRWPSTPRPARTCPICARASSAVPCRCASTSRRRANCANSSSRSSTAPSRSRTRSTSSRSRSPSSGSSARSSPSCSSAAAKSA